MPVPTLVNYVVWAMLMLSSVTILATVVYILIRFLFKTPKSALPLAITVLTGTLNAAGALWLKASGADVAAPDDAKATITDFYKRVENKDFKNAWPLIHSTRQEEVRKKGIAGPEEFGETYRTTQEYRNFQIHLDKPESPSSRLYWISFEVRDRYPRSTIYDYQWRPAQDAVDAGLVNRQRILAQVLRDLRRNYELPNERIPRVERFVFDSPLGFLFSAQGIAEAARYADLRPINPGSEVDVWSHYIQHIKVQDENGWKIKTGLFPPTLVAPYAPGAEIPSR